MRDTRIFARIMGIKAPWRVKEVRLSVPEQQLEVELSRGKGRLRCPECGKACAGYDSRVRRWRHLDTQQMRTVVVAEVPRVKCAEHGVRLIEVPWAERGSRYTVAFEALAIELLGQTSEKAAAKLLRAHWSVVDAIKARAVKRGLLRLKRSAPQRICVDETSFAKGQNYMTVVSTPGKDGVVMHVGEGCSSESLGGYFKQLTDRERAAIGCVSMDMSAGYIKAVREALPQWQQCICFDKFHVASALGTAVDQTRKQEHKALCAAGDERLKGSKYQWLRNPHNMSRSQWRQFASLRNASLKTSRAWSIKELAMGLWDYSSRVWAERAWKGWLAWALRSRLQPVLRVARTVRKHLWGIINAILMRADNGSAESLNAKIQRVKSRACGFRNKERFRTAIYFHCGGLDLYPDACR